MSVDARRLGATVGGIALAIATAFISFGASIITALAVVVGE